MKIELNPDHLSHPDLLRGRMLKVKESWSALGLPKYMSVIMYACPELVGHDLRVKNTWHMVGMHQDVVEAFEAIVSAEMVRRPAMHGLVT